MKGRKETMIDRPFTLDTLILIASSQHCSKTALTHEEIAKVLNRDYNDYMRRFTYYEQNGIYEKVVTQIKKYGENPIRHNKSLTSVRCLL